MNTKLEDMAKFHAKAAAIQLYKTAPQQATHAKLL